MDANEHDKRKTISNFTIQQKLKQRKLHCSTFGVYKD